MFSCAPDSCQICRVTLSPLVGFCSESFLCLGVNNFIYTKAQKWSSSSAAAAATMMMMNFFTNSDKTRQEDVNFPIARTQPSPQTHRHVLLSIFFSRSSVLRHRLACTHRRCLPKKTKRKRNVPLTWNMKYDRMKMLPMETSSNTLSIDMSVPVNTEKQVKS